LTRRDDILSEITREQDRLRKLRSEIKRSSDSLEALQAELERTPADVSGIEFSPEPVDASSPSLSNSEKVGIFRSLFRGREDVFPRRWENSRSGKSGYAPVCSNDWKTGICEKIGARNAAKRPGTICGNCHHQAFLPVTDEEVIRHLTGGHVMGVYPLLHDETCWFLAADFDKKSWDEDVTAFARTCEAHGVPLSIERSRSGNGAHAWIFFASPVQASIARSMGCFLITQTMARRLQVSMDSYDRFFPNQDTMPKGGFGNLIALPLQKAAREQGNSVFVDVSLVRYPDQWAALKGFTRIEPALARSIAEDADNSESLFALRGSESETDGEHPPVKRISIELDSGSEPVGPFPSTVNAVFSRNLVIQKAGLPSSLILKIRQLAAFQNPEFYKRQNLRLSTALTPRVISCFEESDTSIAIPRGCREQVEELFRQLGSTLNLIDERASGTPLDLTFRGTLTSVQTQAAESLLKHDMGVLVAPPGFGKTVLGINLIAARRTNTLVLVHRKELLNLWVVQIEHYLGIPRDAIGQIGTGTRTPTGNIDVAMIQSLVHKENVDSLVTEYGHIVADECHHLPAASFERVMAAVKARYLTGLTATLQRRDGHHPIIQMQLGPVRFKVHANSQAARNPFKYRLIARETTFRPPPHVSEDSGIQEMYSALAADQDRNDLIFDDVIQALEERRSPILLTERRDHLEHFAERLRRFTHNMIVLHGQMKKSERLAMLARLAAVPEGDERLILATGRYIGEGFDDARLDTLFLALPVSWKGTLIQYAGRLHRTHPGKKEVQIYDYVDRNVPVLKRMYERRVGGYRAIGYKVVEESNKAKAEKLNSDTIDIFRESGTKSEDDQG
jgi:superfamily II DNA or RNA helicase